MDIRSLGEFRQADERTLRFTSLGLATGGKLRPEDAAVFQQEVISHAELVPAVAGSTRNTSERLRSLHAYGVLFYDIFTAVEDLTHLVIEQALRDRFLEFHDGVVPFEGARGTVHEVTAATFDVLYGEIRKEPAPQAPAMAAAAAPDRRTDLLDSLLRWARGEGLLRGQRNRRLEPILKRFRDRVAHGAGDHLVMPVDTARTISDAAEIINHLWGIADAGNFESPGHLACPTS